jgi:hypothetical protein
MRTCLFVLAALVAGCHWDLNSKSTDPQSDQLYFPAGIAMDPSGQYVYVSNGNADLRYGGGTVMMIDMFSFECTVAAYRLLHPLSVMEAATVTLPAGCTAQPDHTLDYYQHLAEYNALCYRDRLDPTIVDCDESAFILQNSTVRVGNFAGAIRIAPDSSNPPDPQHRTLFVAVRGDPSVTRIDVHFPNSTTANPGTPMTQYAPPDISAPGVLQCVGDPRTLPALKMGNPAPIPCDATFLVQDYYCQSQPTCTVGVNNNGKTQLPTEPFGMVIDSSDPSQRRLVVSHLATGQISVIAVDKAPSMALLSESSEFFPPDVTGRHGAFALAQQNPTDRHSLWYVTSSVNPLIATFRIADADVVTVSAQSSFGLSNTFANGNDVRDFKFDNGGQRAFVTQNNPPSLMVLDTRVDDTEGSQPHNIVTDVINVCQTPSHIGVRRFAVTGAPGTPPYLKTKVIVVCFLSSQIMIVDPDRPGVDDTVFTGLSGPNDIAFNFSDAGSSQPIADVGLARHAYVTNYSESTIAIVDLEPNSLTENHVLARLGHPPDGFNP